MINDYETFLIEHVLGNLYSIRSEHTKAVAYFRRAVKLDPGYLAAWTLMGHEFVELSNTHAAIEAYRKACSKYELLSSRSWLTNRNSRQQQGLQGVVRLRPGLRTSWNACICPPLLSTRDRLAALRCKNVAGCRKLLHPHI